MSAASPLAHPSDPLLRPDAAQQEVFAGIDVGGTSIKAALVGADGAVLAHTSAPTPPGGAAMAEVCVRLVQEVCRERGLATGSPDGGLAGVGLGAAGVVDQVARMVTTASDTFVDWAGYPIGKHLDEALGVHSVIENDVNAFLIGEVEAGAGRGLTQAVGIALGTGVGGALWLDGALFPGVDGAAGEIGHMPGFLVPGFGEEPCTCGQIGHLESIASARSIVRRYEERGGLPGLSCAEVFARSQVGDAVGSTPDDAARAVFVEAGTQVGRAAVIVATLLSITDVIVGGGVAHAWPLLSEGVEAYIAARPPISGQRLTIHRGALGGLAVAVGAAICARSAAVG